jgi:cytochrome c
MKTTSMLAVVVSVYAGIATTGVIQSVVGRAAAQGSGAERQLAPGLVMPSMDSVHGKQLFASKGCVICHSINGVGGTDAPKLDASTMAPVMNPFEFFAKMWRGAAPMIAMQQSEIGHQIEFTGQDLADIVAFVHNRNVQKTFSAADIPPAIKKHMKGD